MPTKTKEYSLYAPGSLVMSAKDIYSADPHWLILSGTAGIVVSGPQEGYAHHCQVHFVSLAEPWWVSFSEIEPCLSPPLDTSA